MLPFEMAKKVNKFNKFKPSAVYRAVLLQAHLIFHTFMERRAERGVEGCNGWKRVSYYSS